MRRIRVQSLAVCLFLCVSFSACSLFSESKESTQLGLKNTEPSILDEINYMYKENLSMHQSRVYFNFDLEKYLTQDSVELLKSMGFENLDGHLAELLPILAQTPDDLEAFLAALAEEKEAYKKDYIAQLDKMFKPYGISSQSTVSDIEKMAKQYLEQNDPYVVLGSSK